jgi:sporulation protein YlmC with PRC-barrel domain
MARHADEHGHTASPVAQPKLVKLSDSGFRLGDRASDVRGLGVFSQDGERMGNVKDLYVDTVDRAVRFLDVGAGGFLGLREKRFLIPVEAVTNFREGGVTVEQQSREEVNEPSPLNTNVVPEAAYERDLYDNY